MSATRQQHQAIIRDLHVRLAAAKQEIQTLKMAKNAERDLKNKWRMLARHLHAELIAHGLETTSPADIASRRPVDGAD